MTLRVDGPPARPSSRGLDEEEAVRRLAADGPNELDRGRRDTVLRQVGRQLRDVVVLVLLVASGLTAAVGDGADTAVILAVVVVNTALGVTQERRSGRVLTALSDLTSPSATVVRSGRRVEVPARDVVRGDLVVLRAGDIVPADLTVSEAVALELDESAMTGEALPVERAVGETAVAGTVVTRGRGEGVVAATGGHTRLARLARAVAAPSAGTPLQRQLAGLGRLLAAVVAVAAVLVAVLGVLTGRSLETSVVIGLSLAVAAIPESLPAVVSLSLAMAAWRMAAVGVLVRRLPAVEALGSVTVLATDKTGTLTTGSMSVASVWAAEGGDARHVLQLAALCNDAPVGGPATETRVDPLESALVAGAVASGVDVVALRARHPRTAEEPFDAATARMTTVHRPAGRPGLDVCKGSPESIARVVTSEGGAPPPDLAAAVDRSVAAGQRVLAVGERGDGPWRVAGVIGLADPVRADARGFVEAFHGAGVQVVMITGDHAVTAHAVAAAVGIDDDDGSGRPHVFARVRPDRKSEIVKQLQRAGDVVAMTGDGVNDAPALRRADVGVAMGIRGTEVARQAADLVLTGDDLGSLGAAIGEGRRIYDNLRRFLHYGLAGGLAEVLVMLLGGVVGHAIPLGAGQILWINLLTHGLPVSRWATNRRRRTS